jgi:site-specific recombinase XerD
MASKKGICPLCKSYRWLGGKDKACKPCSYPLGSCIKCKSKRKIYVDGLCYLCYQDRQVLKQLQTIKYKFKSEYKNYIFDLYLTYIKRYRLCYFHVKQVNLLKELLLKKPFPTILTWSQVYKLSEQYKLYHSSKTNKGCAITKIGYMLEELGVLPPRGDELSNSINRLFNLFDDDLKEYIQQYLNAAFINKAQGTKLNNLIHLSKFTNWYKKHYNSKLFVVNEEIIRRYLLTLFNENYQIKYIRGSFLCIKMFYRWCKFKKLILYDPCNNINIPRAALKFCICNKEQVLKLESFIKNPNSDARHAFLLSLILYWGFTSQELAFAKIGIQNNEFCIYLRQKALTSGKHYYNREQIIKLPKNPDWFLKLQTSFYKEWRDHYNKIKNTYPNYQLILPKHNHYNRSISKTTVRKIIKKASIEATGINIPTRVIRQTCGHMYSKNQDASILSKLGWSQSFAFSYTWAPVVYYSPEQNYNLKSTKT